MLLYWNLWLETVQISLEACVICTGLTEKEMVEEI